MFIFHSVRPINVRGALLRMWCPQPAKQKHAIAICNVDACSTALHHEITQPTNTWCNTHRFRDAWITICVLSAFCVDRVHVSLMISKGRRIMIVVVTSCCLCCWLASGRVAGVLRAGVCVCACSLCACLCLLCVVVSVFDSLVSAKTQFFNSSHIERRARGGTLYAATTSRSGCPISRLAGREVPAFDTKTDLN